MCSHADREAMRFLVTESQVHAPHHGSHASRHADQEGHPAAAGTFSRIQEGTRGNRAQAFDGGERTIFGDLSMHRLQLSSAIDMDRGGSGESRKCCVLQPHLMGSLEIPTKRHETVGSARNRERPSRSATMSQNSATERNTRVRVLLALHR